MVDEIKATDAPAAPLQDAAATTVATTTDSTPAATETVAPAIETPTAEPTKTEAPVENPLGAEPTKAEPAKADAPKTDAPKTDSQKTEAKDAPKTETKPEGDKTAEPAKTEAPVLPTYEAFKLPENIALEKEPLDAFTKILGEIETGKLDHAGIQSKGQALIDLGTKAVTDSITKLNDHYVQIHKDNVKARVVALKADPDLGGDNFESTMATLQGSVAEYGGTAQQIADFRKEITEAGLGASPAICRLINNMQQKINKYTTEGDGNRQVPAQKPAPTKIKAYQQFYQGNG